MPETGSNNKKTYRNLSIRQQLGGQIFSMVERKHLIVEIDTCFTKIIPSKESFSAESCFAADGMEVSSNETLLRTYINDETDLVTLVPNTVMEQMKRHFSEQKIQIYTPLQKAIEKSLKRASLNAVLYFTENNLYITIAEGHRLKYAEVYPITAESDILYCLTEINTDFGIAKSAKVIVTGYDAEKRVKLLKKYIKHCKCE